MDEVGKAEALTVLNQLNPNGQTALYSGLIEGLTELGSIVNPTNQALLLLTDGLPNIVPPRGHIPSFQKFKVDLLQFVQNSQCSKTSTLHRSIPLGLATF